MAPMTKRERVMRTVRFEETDRPPLYDILQNDAIIEHYAGYPAMYEDGGRAVALAARPSPGHDVHGDRTSGAKGLRFASIL